ncbi:MAG TPA: SpvB/TcaC N-terminal domain-containing protein, partial [Gammaproteobacteria bacterium]|nr:SpvB/TcaC N-terminal domain-containing protein [Gammaproteobacteria bacterium]
MKKHSRAKYALISGVWTVLTALSASPAQATDLVGATPGSFAVSPSGAATYTIPIQVPPGIAGMQPQLAFVYSSNSPNGLLGLGWNIAGLTAVGRCPATRAQDSLIDGIDFDSNDKFCLDGQRLVSTGTGTDGNGA